MTLSQKYVDFLSELTHEKTGIYIPILNKTGCDYIDLLKMTYKKYVEMLKKHKFDCVEIEKTCKDLISCVTEHMNGNLFKSINLFKELMKRNVIFNKRDITLSGQSPILYSDTSFALLDKHLNE